MPELPDTTRPTQKISTQEQHYTAQRGDTLGSIAERFSLTPKFLARMNRMRGDTSPTTGIDVGTVLTIPRIEFDPFGPISGAWAEGGWTQGSWKEASPWAEGGPMWMQKGKFMEVGDDDPLNIPNLPGGGIKTP